MMDWREIAGIRRQFKDHENYFENGFAITTTLTWIGYVVLLLDIVGAPTGIHQQKKTS